MLPTSDIYAIRPAVVPADKMTEMTIMPCERTFFFREGEEYELTVIDRDADEINYYVPTTHKKLTAKASGGVIKFNYAFEGEQTHCVRLFKNGKQLCDLFIFSVYPDLYELTPMRGDLHSHTHRSDGKRDSAAMASHYREQGYDFYVSTDHNRYYTGAEVNEVFEGVKLGLLHIRGEEVHAPGGMLHIVHAGGRESVADIYVHDRERYNRELAECMEKVPAEIPESLRDRYAMAMWSCENIHKVGGLAIFPHPFWASYRSGIHNVCSALAERLLMSKMFDAYELIGAMPQPDNNRSVAFWADLREKGLKISVVGSSDVHNPSRSNTFGNYFTVCFAKNRSADGVLEAIKDGQSVAVEAVGVEYERQYRAYGSHRLVTYAQFLLGEYFPKLQRICAGEGVAMRAYAMGEASAELIEIQARATADFSDRFFGRKPLNLPTKEMLDFEDRARAVHANGPITCGSVIDSDVVTRNDSL